MSDNHHSQNPLTDDEQDALELWTTIGLPGDAAVIRFTPSEEQKYALRPIGRPKTIFVAWFFTYDDYTELQYGHHASVMEDVMEDKWDVYMQDNVVHFHRSWTGQEIFRFQLLKNKQGYMVNQFIVEQDPEKYRTTNEEDIKDTLLEVLWAVMGVSPQLGGR